MAGYMEGVALGMLHGDVYRAESAARSANARADRLEKENQRLREELENARGWSEFNAVHASAGYIVMNAMIKAMQNLPEDVREKFRQEVVQLAKDRMKVVDAMRAARDKMNFSIQSEFMKEEQYKILGFDA